MTTSYRNICCPGCFPIYQPNQQAHSDVGGCLWCDYEDTNKMLEIEKDLETLFDDVYVEEQVEKAQKADDSSDISLNSTQTECCICFELINKNKNNCTTECGHTFCLKCLASAMYHDTWSCPYCRTSLIELPEAEEEEEEEDEEDDEFEDGEEEDGDDEDDDEYDEYDNNVSKSSVEEITRRLQEKGLTMEDLVSLYIYRPKGDDNEMEEGDDKDKNLQELSKTLVDIVYEADKEKYERDLFALEDPQVPVNA